MNLDAERQSRRTWLWASLTTALFAFAAVVSWLGTREVVPSRSGEKELPESSQAAGPVHHIEVPHQEPDWPSAPHREQFRTSCTICHSTQLVNTQPAFPEKKWGEVVKKMVDVYGAPITKDQERDIVNYLAAVKGN